MVPRPGGAGRGWPATAGRRHPNCEAQPAMGHERRENGFRSQSETSIIVQIKVLVVDDDRHIVGLLTQLFRDEGFEVLTAADGLVALDYVDRGKADIVVSDVMMPRLSGNELARRLRSRPDAVPVVLISAIPPQPDTPDVPFIRKPFDLDHLLQVVNELLEPQTP